MAVKNIAVFGIYPDQLTAEDAVDTLKGLTGSEIRISRSCFRTTRAQRISRMKNIPRRLKGALTGGSSGRGDRRGAGLVGRRRRVSAIPGVGPFIAAGPLMAMLGGIGVGSAIGGLTGALIGLGIPEYEAKRYEGRIKRGSIYAYSRSTATTRLGSPRQRTSSVIRRGAEDVASTGEAKADFAASDNPSPRAGGAK